MQPHPPQPPQNARTSHRRQPEQQPQMPPAPPMPPMPPSRVKKGFSGLAVTFMVAGAIVAGCAGGVVIGSASAKPISRPSTSSTSRIPPAAESAAETQSSAPAQKRAYTPKPSDFTITVKIIRSTCYGSAGANVTYRIDPKYHGPALPEDGSWTISYRISGGEDPDTGSFEMTGDGTANIDEKEFIDTPTCTATLKAKATQVLAS